MLLWKFDYAVVANWELLGNYKYNRFNSASELSTEGFNLNIFFPPGTSQPEASLVDGEGEQPWAPSESGASNGPRGEEEGEEDEEGPPNEVNGGEKGARWMWGAEQRRLRGQPLGEEDEEDEEEEEENNNSSSHQEEEEEAEDRTGGGPGREREEEEEDEEEMDQDSDEFEHSGESGREEEEEGDREEGLRSPSHRNNVSAPNNNRDSGCTHQSSSHKKVSTAGFC